MSKLEEALQKAKSLREPTDTKQPMPFTGVKKEIEIESLDIKNPYIVSVAQPDSPIAEEYRKLKSMVIKATKADFLNTIMITSTIDKEGKTLTAINLAISMAQEIDHSILLIDADLRKPFVHEYLGIKPKYGLSDYLTKDVPISEILIRTGVGNLVFMPAGNRVKNPVELLSSSKMKTLVDELKHRYVDRYIIMDTPPLLPFAESITMGSYVDGVIFVVKEGHAQMKSIKDAMSVIKDLNILGVVFNGVSNENLDGHYYSRYYRYYYGQRKEDLK